MKIQTTTLQTTTEPISNIDYEIDTLFNNYSDLVHVSVHLSDGSVWNYIRDIEPVAFTPTPDMPRPPDPDDRIAAEAAAEEAKATLTEERPLPKPLPSTKK